MRAGSGLITVPSPLRKAKSSGFTGHTIFDPFDTATCSTAYSRVGAGRCAYIIVMPPLVSVW